MDWLEAILLGINGKVTDEEVERNSMSSGVRRRKELVWLAVKRHKKDGERETCPYGVRGKGAHFEKTVAIRSQSPCNQVEQNSEMF